MVGNELPNGSWMTEDSLVQIALEAVQAVDAEFRGWSEPRRRRLILRFQEEQPFLVGHLSDQDKVLFPNLPGRVFPIGCLCWNVFGVLGRKRIPRVSKELLGQVALGVGEPSGQSRRGV